MRAAGDGRGQLARDGHGPLVTPSHALAFGRSGGCRASPCELCAFRPLCDGGEAGYAHEGTDKANDSVRSNENDDLRGNDGRSQAGAFGRRQ